LIKKIKVLSKNPKLVQKQTFCYARFVFLLLKIVPEIRFWKKVPKRDKNSKNESARKTGI